MSLFDDASLVLTPNGYKEGKLYSIKPTDGSGDLDVVRATTATRVNSDGLIEVTPYNLVSYSEQFDNASWIKFNSSIIANSTTAPNGTTTADKLIENTASESHFVQQSIVASNTSYTFSVFAKKAERKWVVLRSVNASFQNVKAWFNIDDGTIGTLENGATAKINNYDNGWYKLEMTIPSFSTGFEFRINTSTENGVDSYTGDGTSGIYIWGAQLEVGTSAKDYFPTTDRLNISRLDYTNGSCPSILVEPQRTNLVKYSEDFSNVGWTKSNATVTLSSELSPMGMLNAYDVVYTSGGYILESVSTTKTIGSSETISVFSKSDIVGTFLKFGGGTASGTDVEKKENYGNGWFRYSVTRTFTEAETGSTQLIISSSDIGLNAILFGTQLEAGSYATSYIPTQGSAVTRNADVISKTGISDLIGQTEGTVFIDFLSVNNFNGSSGTLFEIKQDNNNRITIYFSNGTPRLFGVEDTITLFNQALSLTIGSTCKLGIKYNSISTKVFINGSLIHTLQGINNIDFSDFSILANNNINYKNIQLYKEALTDQECIELTTL